MSTSKLWAMMEHRTGPLCGILEAVVAPENIIEEEEEEEEEDGEGEDSEEDEEAAFESDEDEDMSGLSDEDEDEDEEDEEEYESDDGESILGDTTMELSRTEDLPDLGSDSDSDSDDAEEAPDDEEAGQDYLHNIDLDRAQNPRKVVQRRAHPTLDDSFFSIDDFNRETEALEAHNRSAGALNEDDEDEDDEDVDLFMDVQDIEDTPQEANDPKYQDFFAPISKSKLKSTKSPEKPRRRVKLIVASPPGPKRSTKVRFNEEVKVRNIKSKRTKASLLAELMEAVGEGDEGDEEGDDEEGPWASEMLDESADMDSEEDDEDEEMDSDESSDAEPSKNDLFADDDEENESEAGLSTHQKRLATLSAEIQALEAENVAPKPWTMQGEATSRSRPQNALLEADLEFEHVGKVVPIVTEESVKTLEEKIKARILEGRYDDVVRKRDIEAKPFLPSRMFELKDAQSEKSLAQIYEDEYTAAASGSKPVDDRDGKLAESHKEITELWDGICHKLDALSNAHFTPKQASLLGSLTNMASASLESALPTSLSTSTLLAPEEVYTASSSEVRARSELTPLEKKAARGRERKKRRKERGTMSSAVEAAGKGGRQPRNVKEAKEQALNGLVKNGKGVTVVGKASKNGGKGDPKSKANGLEKEERDGKKFKL
ncbi:U3 small nucleolar RNA-associated protein MPP10 Short=U3 snoRNA-associated protein MPP10 [Rhizoctonia solani AG-1 IB]|uniref:U3 small nucleolar ribonucleoprotein protein MPP10 n=1 Tax=Thanatephorus cucumeris (strain AG1-IB / isolate 7/3/14) TaxID=1108050 RepID=M5C7D3_THACB|nr:U3 small nucleolar RNA-associated protein MPP10 Short=U3 snoRNA-associated protein MPP10 [Rhizoctonia solani AG-1 IB]